MVAVTVKDHIRLLLDYEKWANQRVLESIERAAHPGRSVRLFRHILAAQEVWLARLRGEDAPPTQVWSEATVQDCRERLSELETALETYLASLTDDSLEVGVEYRNLADDPFRHTPHEILTHLSLHSQYHRGQIAQEIKDEGGEAVATDFIVFRR